MGSSITINNGAVLHRTTGVASYTSSALLNLLPESNLKTVVQTGVENDKWDLSGLSGDELKRLAEQLNVLRGLLQNPSQDFTTPDWQNRYIWELMSIIDSIEIDPRITGFPKEPSEVVPPFYKLHHLPLKLYRDATRLEDLQLEKIRSGILIVYATWAGHLNNMKRLRILKTLDLDSLEVIFLDTDCIDNYIRLFGHVLGGAAEIFWVQDGKIVAECSPWSKMTDEDILCQTKALLGRSASA